MNASHSPKIEGIGAAPPGPASGQEADDDARDLFTIRDLAKEFAVSARTLRFYEEKGLLNPRRDGQERSTAGATARG